MAVIFAFSTRSTVPQSSAIPSQITSIIGHLVVYAILAILISKALEHDIRNVLQRVSVAWIASVIYGISDEIHQSFVPGRHATLSDVVTDAIGAACGLGLMIVYMRMRGRDRATI